MGLAMTEKDYRDHRFSEKVAALSPEIVEAIVISNCKRIEIVIATDASADITSIRGQLVSMIEGWVSMWEEEKGERNSNSTNSNFTQGAVCLGSNATPSDEIPDYFSTLSGVETVSRYLCLVAAGIPPESPLHVFSPYLSRDAHVLKQLKQAFAAASTSNPTSSSSASSMSPPPPCRGRLGALLRGCLEAGKAARDSGVVPELVALRPSLQPSREERTRVAKAVCLKGVDPVVARSVAAFAALDRGQIICEFREKARSVVENIAREHEDFAAVREIERGYMSIAVRRELHEPMLALRSGIRIDEASVMKRVARAGASDLKADN